MVPSETPGEIYLAEQQPQKASFFTISVLSYTEPQQAINGSVNSNVKRVLNTHSLIRYLVPDEAPGENAFSHRVAASKSQASLLLQGHTSHAQQRPLKMQIELC